MTACLCPLVILTYCPELSRQNHSGIQLRHMIKDGILEALVKVNEKRLIVNQNRGID